MSARPPRALTPQQQAAVFARGTSIALGAGAGSGKTTVLTARFLAALEPPTGSDLRRVVAVTFTEKAARELRRRVRRECRGRRDDEYWRTVLRGLEAAPIGTFHAFCARILRRWAIAAGIDPGFRVLDEAVGTSLRERVLNAFLRERLIRDDPDLVPLAIEFGLTAVRDRLAALIQQRLVGDLEDDPDRLDRWREIWEQSAKPKLLDRYREQHADAIALLSANGQLHRVLAERVASVRDAWDSLGRGGNDAEALAAIQAHARIQGAGTEKAYPSASLYQAIKEGLTALREGADKLGKKLRIDPEADLRNAERAGRFARLAQGAVASYQEAKRRDGLLDFDDLLEETRVLLRDQPEAREAFAEAFDLVLVDEFQDTDPVQGEILEALAGAEIAAGKLFLVGDAKQSIYRFRRAQPRVFQHFRERFEEAGRLPLSDNFRSVPELIDFANALFAGIYDHPDDALRSGPGTPPPGDRTAVEFLWADAPPDSRISADERRQAEARRIASRLAEGLAAGGWLIRDPETGAERPARAGDVTILLRTLNDAAPYERALDEVGLDFRVVGGSAFFAQPEIQDVVHLLSCLEDPTDEPALAALLRSPWFSVSDEGLLALERAGRGEFSRGFQAHEATIPERDRDRIARARSALARWRGLKDRLGLAELLETILEESGVEAALIAERLGARKRANVRKLIRLAERFDAADGVTLATFVARLRADARKPPREEQAATQDEWGECVRLMTVHQSKGLEFPVVVLADLNRASLPAGQDRIALHPELGIVPRPLADDTEDEDAGTTGWMAYLTLEDFEERDEALRLFYVGTTRARDRLILSAGMAATERPTSPALKLLAERFNLATGESLAELPGGWVVPRILSLARSSAPPPRGKRSARPPLLKIARLLRPTSNASEAIPADRPAPPAKGVLRLGPDTQLGDRAGRVDRLFRAVLTHDERHPLAPLRDRIASEARRQRPASPYSLQAEAERLLRHPLMHEFQDWLRGQQARLFSWRWSLPGPDGRRAEGLLDLLARNSAGEWSAVVFRTGEPRDRARLRLALGSRAAASWADGPIRSSLLFDLAGGAISDLSGDLDGPSSLGDLHNPHK